ncbi:Biopterin transport-related protein BT1 [Tribonema minus]|uniref:Biopterin transport-related protein BT1 n=1 Tax=Tribonema minus TaxID=303371 RepID=A0A835Z8G1_9STRA|nr:Biopterin transport-related protein BT1 [Tribonema minus]
MSDIWAAPNRAVPASYFCVGIAMSFLRTPVSYYLVHELGASPSQQNVVVTLAMLPWSFKLVYGFISDNFPIGGMRRKPYFIAGWFIYSMCNLLLAATGRPGVQSVALLQLLGTCGFMMSDVTTDAIIVERSKNEPEETRGSMQATGYATRFCGSLLGSVLGTCVYNKERWGWGMTIGEVFLLNGLFPLLVVAPFMWTLRESAYVPRPGDRAAALRAQCDAIFTALSLRSVFVPMAVVFTYNLFQVPNAAWRSFLVEGLKFESFDLGLIGIVGSLFSSCGLIAYKRCFMGTGWRTIYRVTTTLTCFFSVVQLLLIFRVNQRFGVGDLAFALGDDALAEFVSAIQFLPVCQMYISMCPEGTEGTTYAILTTLSNVAGAVSFSIGTLLTHLWDVSNEAFAAGQFGGMWRLTLLTSLIQPLPLVLMGYLPANAEQQRAMQGNKESYRWGGTAFLVVLFGSLAWTIIESLIVIL